jgi:hypothetical protein
MQSRHVWLAVAVVLVSVLAAACGGGSPSSVASLSPPTSTSATPTGGAGASTPYTNALNYARCMRGHGEPAFPDPNNPGGFSTSALAQLDPTSRQFLAANNKCQGLLPNTGVEFPDPGTSSGQLILNLADVDTSAPKCLAAAQIWRTKPGT